MKKVLRLFAVVVLVLIAIVVVRTLVIPSKQIGRLPHTPEAIDSQKVAGGLAGAIPFQTISFEDGGTAEQKEIPGPHSMDFTVIWKRHFRGSIVPGT